jgi:uncharacterized OB-fold protein
MAYAMQGGGVRDDQFFWDGLAEHKLLFQQCSDCGTIRHPIEPMCGNCGSLEWGTFEASGHGVVYTWILSHHPNNADDIPPRLVALINLDEGIRLVSNVIGIDPEQIANDIEVQVDFVERDDGVTLHAFRPVAGGS